MNIKMINGYNDAQRFSLSNRISNNQCFMCGWVYRLGSDEELKNAIRSVDGELRNKYLASWIYNKTLKRQLPVCPKCGSGILRN